MKEQRTSENSGLIRADEKPRPAGLGAAAAGAGVSSSSAPVHEEQFDEIRIQVELHDEGRQKTAGLEQQTRTASRSPNRAEAGLAAAGAAAAAVGGGVDFGLLAAPPKNESPSSSSPPNSAEEDALGLADSWRGESKRCWKWDIEPRTREL